MVGHTRCNTTDLNCRSCQIFQSFSDALAHIFRHKSGKETDNYLGKKKKKKKRSDILWKPFRKEFSFLKKKNFCLNFCR